MKKIFLIITIISAFALGGCTKNDPVIYTGSVVEFDASTWSANSAGLSYPIVTKVPVVGGATTSSSSTANLTRTIGSFTVRVNLVGAQRTADTQFSYQVSAAETTALSGVHYTAFTGIGTIPANSSYGFITVNVLNPGPSAGGPVVLVLQLMDNANFKANVNYSKLGLSIAQN